MSLTLNAVASQNRRNIRLANEFRMVTKAPHEHLDVIMPNDADTHTWMFRLRNLCGDFAGGEYIGRIRATLKNPNDPNSKAYPDGPPVFMLYTPNGVVAINTEKVCTTMSQYHSGDWKAGKMNMIGFMMLIVKNMQEWLTMGSGLGWINNHLFVDRSDIIIAKEHEIEASRRSIRSAATTSRAFNTRRYAELVAEFDDTVWNRSRAVVAAARLSAESRAVADRYLAVI